MRLEFTYTPEDLEELQSLSSKVKAPGAQRLIFGLARGFLGWVVFIGLAIGLFILSNWKTRSTPAAPVRVVPKPTNPWEILLPMLPWVLIFGFIWFFLYRRLRGYAKKQWLETPELQVRQQMEITDEGVTLATPTATTNWRWQAFSASIEGVNTILLRISGNARLFVSIPKRAFNEAELQELRALLGAHVQPQTGAFPVIPTEKDRT
jgi:YcxB-like protein